MTLKYDDVGVLALFCFDHDREHAQLDDLTGLTHTQ